MTLFYKASNSKSRSSLFKVRNGIVPISLRTYVLSGLYNTALVTVINTTAPNATISENINRSVRYTSLCNI